MCVCVIYIRTKLQINNEIKILNDKKNHLFKYIFLIYFETVHNAFVFKFACAICKLFLYDVCALKLPKPYFLL